MTLDFSLILLIRCPDSGEPTDNLCGVQSLNCARGFSQPVVKRASIYQCCNKLCRHVLVRSIYNALYVAPDS
jgi:hypothetical protein